MKTRTAKPSSRGANGAAKGKGRPLRLEWIEAGSLEENPHNWRRHPEGQMKALKGVLDDKEVGWAGALLYNERTQRLIDGHGRKKAVSPETPVPVLIGNWSEAAEKKILLTLDPLAAMATAEEADLRSLLEAVDLSDDQMSDLSKALDADLAEMGEKDAATRTTVGEVFQILILCRDKTHQDDLMGTLKAQDIDCQAIGQVKFRNRATAGGRRHASAAPA